MGSFQETAPRKTAENSVIHCDGGAGSEIANHFNGCESSVVLTTLKFVLHYIRLWELKVSNSKWP